jgi:hypothetical protein
MRNDILWLLWSIGGTIIESRAIGEQRLVMWRDSKYRARNIEEAVEYILKRRQTMGG